jgi:2-methylisocitrate lyase-like PEP mutase family enzyme
VSTAAARLRALHSGPRPLILPNVWDPVSALAFASAGFGALATSSSAIAAALGYKDGETPADEMLAAVGRIASSVDVPVTADVEAGYGLSAGELVRRLADCGVAGCNLEDSDSGTRLLTDPGQQARYLAAVRAEAGPDLVINARVDVYVRPPAGGGTALGDPAVAEAALADAVARGNAFLGAGADCAYPILAPAPALPELVRLIDGPVNAMFRPGGPSLAQLAAMGAARITFGGGLHAEVAHHVQDEAERLAAEVASLAANVTDAG